jgi:hypothetical protein
MSLAIGREQRLMQEAKRRQDERLAEVRLEQQLVPRAPEFLGVVTVLPPDANADADADSARPPNAASDELLAQVREIEASQGRSLDDIRDERLGLDAIAQDAEGQDARFILAREVDGDSRLWLRASAWALAQHLDDRVAMYAARDGQLLKLTSRDAALAATVDDVNRRVSIQLDGPVRSPGTTPNRGEA